MYQYYIHLRAPTQAALQSPKFFLADFAALVLAASVAGGQGKKNRQCPKCKKTFYNMPNLRRHYTAAHQPSVKLQCHLCLNHYKNEHSLKNHLRNAHNVFQKDQSLIDP